MQGRRIEDLWDCLWFMCAEEVPIDEDMSLDATHSLVDSIPGWVPFVGHCDFSLHQKSKKCLSSGVREM